QRFFQYIDRSTISDTTSLQSLTAYPKGEKAIDIETYEEFKESKCELIVLAVDAQYIQIYVKDQKAIELMYENARKQGFYVKYVTDENDGRTRLSVW
ncbi:DUF2691 family protein, partial [Bacillus sp. HC-TM]